MTEAGPLSSISLSSRLAHCAIGSNRTSAAATWSDGFFNDTVKNRRGLLAYPAGHFVAVYDPAVGALQARYSAPLFFTQCLWCSRRIAD